MTKQIKHIDLHIKRLAQMRENATNATERVKLECALAKRFEDAGDYEAAREVLETTWHGVGERPRVEGFDAYTSALVLLRAGTLTGWLGSANGENAQERAKDLISLSLAMFEMGGCKLEAIETQYELSLCYWREGAFDEARIVLRTALDKLSELESEKKEELHARLLIRAGLVERCAQRLDESVRLLEEARPLVGMLDDDLLKGKFHGELATTLNSFVAAPKLNAKKHEEYLDRALIEFAAASFHFEQAGHIRYCARVENNAAMLYLQLTRYADAHAHLDRAEKLLKEFKDIGVISGIRETRARILLAEERFGEAVVSARKASEGFTRSGEQAWAAEALTTQGMALARMEDEYAADTVMRRAIEMAELVGDLEGAGRAALTLMEELAEYLTVSRAYEVFERADDLLSRTSNQELIGKVRTTGRRLVRRMHTELQLSVLIVSLMNAGEVPCVEDEEFIPVKFADVVHHLEAKMIERAMHKSKNQVTRAAALLGISHQHLSLLLRTRHKGLYYLVREPTNPFKPRKRRRQNVMKDV
ncbi:MAG: hypothetical protein NVSMB56_02380 [Pyrinomonadaceae bacterium]